MWRQAGRNESELGSNMYSKVEISRRPINAAHAAAAPFRSRETSANTLVLSSASCSSAQGPTHTHPYAQTWSPFTASQPDTRAHTRTHHKHTFFTSLVPPVALCFQGPRAELWSTTDEQKFQEIFDSCVKNLRHGCGKKWAPF